MAVRQNSCQPTSVLPPAVDLLHGADCTSIPWLANIVLSSHGPAAHPMEMKAAFLRPIDSKWVKARLSTERNRLL